MGRLWKTACLEVEGTELTMPLNKQVRRNNNGAVSHRLRRVVENLHLGSRASGL